MLSLRCLYRIFDVFAPAANNIAKLQALSLHGIRKNVFCLIETFFVTKLKEYLHECFRTNGIDNFKEKTR